MSDDTSEDSGSEAKSEAAPKSEAPQSAAGEAEAAPKSEAPQPEAGAAAIRAEGPPPSEERRTRAMILLGVGLTLVGIALSVTEDSFGRWFVLGGVVLAFVALHRFGRLGPLGV